MSDQIFHAESFSRLQHYASHHELAPLWIRYSEDRGLPNRRMLANNRFDLPGVNIFAARDDHVFQAVEDVEIPVGILTADVPRTKQPVSKRACSLFLIIPVAAHDIG